MDGYAEVTNLYSSFDSALYAFVSSNGFTIEDSADPQRNLFPEGSET